MNQMIDNKHTRRKKKKKGLGKLAIFMLILIALIFSLSNKLGNSSIIPTSSKNKVENTPTETTIKMTVIGDIMCHSTNFKAAYNSATKIYDFSNVFSQVKDYVSNSDISIGNLETTFAGATRNYSGYPNFNTPEALAQNLKDLGIDVLSTANNHSLDKGYSGLVTTLDELDKVEISHTGTYRSEEEQNTIVTKDINGIKFAFLSFTYGTNGIPVPKDKEYCINLIDKELIKKQISLAKKLNPDVICVNMHWGLEYKTVQNSEQEGLADFLFENGADIILGSHPHVLQTMEKRTVTLDDGTTKDGFVIYSLGNFMSGQIIAETRNSIILNLQITKHSDNKISIDSYDYIPIYMLDRGANSSNRYEILDINSCIKSYESGDKNISPALYTNLKNALIKITNIMGK